MVVPRLLNSSLRASRLLQPNLASRTFTRSIQIYLHDNSQADQRAPHDSGIPVSIEQAAKLGVLASHFSGPMSDSEVAALAKSRDYKNWDEIVISPESFGKDVYAEKVKMFYEEHIHEDEEIRYIVDGEGFFDVRDKQDNWVRMKMTKGDLIILPAGIYHRFTTTEKDYVKARRLFKDDPKWTPIARPCDDNAFRQEYVEIFA
ncbi:ARD/ARD' family-domain-containing protein [Lipomyces oligophaga]|uniref:ARD/ARD' family-domain-containing protein n=1 Tax=Lipomyces oligophaga TaxID=45792 RepID=UPI0034CE839F